MSVVSDEFLLQHPAILLDKTRQSILETITSAAPGGERRGSVVARGGVTT